MSRPLQFASYLAPALYDTYAAIVSAIAEHVGCMATLCVGEELDDYRIGKLDGAFMCGLLYARLVDERHLPLEPLAAPIIGEARYAGRPLYYSDVIVRRESPYQSLADLRGSTWAYNEDTSHSGYHVVRYHLYRQGLDRSYFGQWRETGSHSASLQAVLTGQAEGSAIDSHVLAVLYKQQPALLEQVRVIDSFGPSTMPPLIVARHLPNELKQTIRTTLCELHQQPGIAALLRAGLIERFGSVTDADYDDIRQMYKVSAQSF